MIMTKDVVSATNITSSPADQQILLAIKKRYYLNPKQKELVFEVGGLGVALNNENGYLEVIAALDGLKEKAGFDYIVEDTYTDRRGKLQHYTLFESRLCKIKVIDKKAFEKALRRTQIDNSPSDNSGKGEIIKHKGLWYNLRSCDLRYKNSKPTTVSPENREMKFFLHLYQHKGNVCLFKNIAREVNTAGYKEMTSVEDESTTHEKLINRDFTDEVSAVKRDFRTILLSLGMSKKEFDKMVIRVPKLGFKLM